MEAMLAIPIEYVGAEPQKRREKTGLDTYLVGVARPILAHFLDAHPVIPPGSEGPASVVAKAVGLRTGRRIEFYNTCLDPMSAQEDDPECPQSHQIPPPVGPDGGKRRWIDRLESEQWFRHPIQESRAEGMRPSPLGYTVEVRGYTKAHILSPLGTEIALLSGSNPVIAGNYSRASIRVANIKRRPGVPTDE